MFLALLLSGCIFDTEDDDDDDDDDDRDDAPAVEDTTDAPATAGSIVRFKTTELDIEPGAEVPAPAPDGGTFVRVDSCYDDGTEVVCDIWAGGYQLYEDGSLVLTPSTWDGELARVTWLVIE